METKVKAFDDLLGRLAAEICRQSVERQKREKENFEKLVELLNHGTKGFDLDIQELGEKLRRCCSFKIGADDI